MLDKVKISRDAEIPLFPFKDYFRGFERVDAVRMLFGENTEKVLGNLKLEFYSGRRGYMGVNDVDGHIRINAGYLKKGPTSSIYLDIIHELVHVKQYMEGKELFDSKFQYVDRPTEIAAYKVTVEEARRLGLSDKEIFEHLKMDSMTEKEHMRLARNVGLRAPRTVSKKQVQGLKPKNSKISNGL